MFSSAKVAEIMNGVLNQPEYKVPIKELNKRIEENQLAHKLEDKLAEKTVKTDREEDMEH